MAGERTFYCPRCGNPITAMPSHAIACPRCGRTIGPRLVSPAFSNPPAPPALPYAQPPPLPSRRGTPGIVVALLLYFFFPVGLFLLWTHPVWTESQKWKYTIIWLSIFGGLFILPLLMTMLIGLVSSR